MFRPEYSRLLRHAACVLIAAGVVVTSPAAPVSAQGLLDFLFGNVRRAMPSAPPPAWRGPSPFEELFGSGPSRRGARESIHESQGPRSAFCVRLCDGRYFPIQGHRHASAVAQCSALCPAAPTKVFSGGSINHAVAADGRRYADLGAAFVYRERLVPGCTCNGVSAVGTARVQPSDDPTLRAGDIIATNSGLEVFRGRDRNRQADFTPVESARVSRGLRAQLAELKVRPELPNVAEAAPAVRETTGLAPQEPEAVTAAVTPHEDNPAPLLETLRQRLEAIRN